MLKDFDRRIGGIEIDRDDVEPAWTFRQTVTNEILLRGANDAPLLERGDRFYSGAERATIPRLHFDEHNRRPVPRDDVQFAAACAVAPGKNCVPPAFELAAGEIFA